MAEAGRMRPGVCRAMILILIAILALPGAVSGNSAPAVTNVRIGTFDGFSRIVLRTNAPLSPKLYTLGKPDRLIIDLPEVDWRIASPKGDVDSRLVRGFRFGLFEPGVSRLVLALSGPARIDSYGQRTLEDGKVFEFDIRLDELEPAPPIAVAPAEPRFARENDAAPPSRLPKARLVDEDTRRAFGAAGFDPQAADFGALGSLLAALNGPAETDAANAAEAPEEPAVAILKRPLSPFPASPRRPKDTATTAAPPETAKPESPATPEVTAKPKPKAVLKPVRIVLDPGHGGKDPGTAPAGIGVTEKEVNLAFSLELRSLLAADPAYLVTMTRDDDTFVSLPDRVAGAKADDADLLVSIHADWFHDPTIKGATAYTLSEEASIRTAEGIASGRGSEETVAGIHVNEERQDVVRVLLDLARRETQTRSRSFGELVIEEFEAVTPVVRGVRNHDLHVLRTADLPAVLIELGYMSNEEDRALLQSPEWRLKTAKAVKRALDRWRIERGMREFARR